VIIRTKVGEDFFYKAVESGVINTWIMEEEPTVIERVLVAAMNKRESGLKKTKEIENASGYFPALLLRETDDLAGIKVADIMTRSVSTVTQNTTVRQFLDLVARYHHIGYPLVNEYNEPIGWVTLEEASGVEKSERDKTLVGQIARRKLVTAYPDETALEAFKRMSESETGRVLVLDRSDPKKLIGVVTKTDLMHALTKD
jgi:CBS domain-containing protein